MQALTLQIPFGFDTSEEYGALHLSHKLAASGTTKLHRNSSDLTSLHKIQGIFTARALR
jgi:hypothetical protein